MKLSSAMKEKSKALVISSREGCSSLAAWWEIKTKNSSRWLNSSFVKDR